MSIIWVLTLSATPSFPKGYVAAFLHAPYPFWLLVVLGSLRVCSSLARKYFKVSTNPTSTVRCRNVQLLLKRSFLSHPSHLPVSHCLLKNANTRERHTSRDNSLNRSMESCAPSCRPALLAGACTIRLSFQKKRRFRVVSSIAGRDLSTRAL